MSTAITHSTHDAHCFPSLHPSATTHSTDHTYFIPFYHYLEPLVQLIHTHASLITFHPSCPLYLHILSLIPLINTHSFVKSFSSSHSFPSCPHAHYHSIPCISPTLAYTHWHTRYIPTFCHSSHSLFKPNFLTTIHHPWIPFPLFPCMWSSSSMYTHHFQCLSLIFITIPIMDPPIPIVYFFLYPLSYILTIIVSSITLLVYFFPPRVHKASVC